MEGLFVFMIKNNVTCRASINPATNFDIFDMLRYHQGPSVIARGRCQSFSKARVVIYSHFTC